MAKAPEDRSGALAGWEIRSETQLLTAGQLAPAIPAHGARALQVAVDRLGEAIAGDVEGGTQVLVALFDVDGFETSEVRLHVAALVDPASVAVDVLEVNDDVHHSPAELAHLGSELVAHVNGDVRGERHVW